MIGVSGEITESKFYSVFANFIIFGASLTISAKMMNSQRTVVDGVEVKWNHPMVQGWLMYFGQ